MTIKYDSDPQYQRITIDDFSPGIFSDYHSGTALASNNTSMVNPKANGAAVVTDTWGCFADRSGALVPLPAVTTGKTHSLPFTAANYLANKVGKWLLDALVLDDMALDSLADSGVEVVTMHDFGYNNGSTLGNYIVVTRWLDWYSGGTTADVCFTKSTADSSQANIASGNLTTIRSAWPGEEALPDSVRRGFAFVARPARRAGQPVTGQNFTSGTLPAADQALTNYDSLYTTAWPFTGKEVIYGWFPGVSPASGFPSAAGFANTSATESWRGGFVCLSHQGRVVIGQKYPAKYESPYTYAWKDRLSCSMLLRPSVDDGGGEYVEENTSGIGVMASLSADEMLVVKHKGGGYLLRGSVNSPTVLKLPFIESTYGVVSTPIATPIGLVYGTRNGVFLWDGGETSKCISEQLDGFFWDHAPTANYDGHRARFGYWNPWVMVPNGFMFDTRGGGWWRLDDPSGHNAYNVYGVSSAGTLYAFPYKIDATHSTLYNIAFAGTQASSWSWKSQPIIETRERSYMPRDVRILATSTSTASSITVTISGFDEQGTAITVPALTFTLAEVFDRPQLITMDVGPVPANLVYMQVKIVANNTEGLPAPKLHNISIGVIDGAPIPGA